MPEVIGIDHIYLSVTDLSVSEAFYDQVLMRTLGFRKSAFVLADDPHIQYYNRQFGFVLRPARVAASHTSAAPGLHHFCLRVESVADVQEAVKALRAAGIDASEATYYPDYAPDYIATFLLTLTVSPWKSPIIDKNGVSGTIIGSIHASITPRRLVEGSLFKTYSTQNRTYLTRQSWRQAASVTPCFPKPSSVSWAYCLENLTKVFT